MKCLIVISVDVPSPDDLPEILDYIEPPKIPYFDNVVRVVVGQDVDDTIAFLDEGETRQNKQEEIRKQNLDQYTKEMYRTFDPEEGD